MIKNKSNIHIKGEIIIFFEDEKYHNCCNDEITPMKTLRLMKPSEIKEFYKNIKNDFHKRPQDYEFMTEYTLKDLLNNNNEHIRKEAEILNNLHYPLHSTWKISLIQVIK